MAACWVIVRRGDGGGVGDAVYINGNYVDAAGVIGAPLVTETGDALFETITAAGTIGWRKEQVIGLPPPGDFASDAVPVTLHPAA